MNKNKILAIAMASAMMTGTLATAVPVFAADNTTTVSVTVAPKNTYTMTVPANTTLNSDGTAKELTNGIKITDGTLEEGKKLIVTATSTTGWEMTATGLDTTIGYGLYYDEAAETEATSWEFTQEEANNAGGSTKNVYVKANTADIENAAAGTYSDVITFTAEVKDAKVAVESVNLNKTATSLTVGNNETLTATVKPDDATDKTVTWTSSDTSVASVDENGNVTAVAVGSATITATADGQSATCQVTVNETISFEYSYNGRGKMYTVEKGTTWTQFFEANNMTIPTDIMDKSSFDSVDLSSEIVAGKYSGYSY